MWVRKAHQGERIEKAQKWGMEEHPPPLNMHFMTYCVPWWGWGGVAREGGCGGQGGKVGALGLTADGLSAK